MSEVLVVGNDNVDENRTAQLFPIEKAQSASAAAG